MQKCVKRKGVKRKGVERKGVKINWEKKSVAREGESGEIQWMTFTVHMHIISCHI